MTIKNTPKTQTYQNALTLHQTRQSCNKQENDILCKQNVFSFLRTCQSGVVYAGCNKRWVHKNTIAVRLWMIKHLCNYV